jgi:hypothetical protein
MSRLGYQRYGAQGGDWGSIISRELGLAAPDHAMEVPDLLTGDVRDFFRPLR